MRAALRWLWAWLMAPPPAGGRLQPDGGPGRHDGTYDWETVPPHPRAGREPLLLRDLDPASDEYWQQLDDAWNRGVL